MVSLTTFFVKGGLRPRIKLVWFDGVRRRPTVRRASGRARAAAWGPGMGVRQRRAVAGLGVIRRDCSVRCSVDDATDRNAGLLRGAGPVPFRHTLFAAACPAEVRAAHQRPNEALQLTEPRSVPAGLVLDRDQNAAINIVHLGLKNLRL